MINENGTFNLIPSVRARGKPFHGNLIRDKDARNLGVDLTGRNPASTFPFRKSRAIGGDSSSAVFKIKQTSLGLKREVHCVFESINSQENRTLTELP